MTRRAEQGGVAGVDLERVWVGVLGRVWTRPPRPGEQVARRLLRSPGLARALVTTPSLALGWVVSSAVVLALGVVVAPGIGAPLVPLLAPAVAGVGIGFAYGPGTDPGYELARSMPTEARMVLLVRVLVVFAVNAVLGVAAVLVTGSLSGLSAVTWEWLAPMTAVASACLVAATLTESATAGVAVGLSLWAATVLGGAAVGGSLLTVVSERVLVWPYLAVAGAGLAVVFWWDRAPISTRNSSVKTRGWA